MYVLIGEFAGDYDDFYERPVEIIACSYSREKLIEHWNMLAYEGHEYVDFRIEETQFLEE